MPLNPTAPMFWTQLLLAVPTSAEVETTTLSAAPTKYTVPASANYGEPVLPNIVDPQAIDAQSVCPGYKVTDVQQRENAFTATLTLAGPPCDVYGDDVDSLQLLVQYQSTGVHVEISPTYLGAENYTWFYAPESELLQNLEEASSCLDVTYGDDPSFWMKVARNTGEVLFDTTGSVLIFENQFAEFKTNLPEDYNIYGLGETVRSLRLGTNFTKTMWNADTLDAVDRNIYGTHPVYYETRYYDKSSGQYIPFGQLGNDSYDSQSHAVYHRNAHGQDILLESYGLTWRTLGGNVDLYIYAGPTIQEATQAYQKTVGLPAMQSYWTFGYHHARGNYTGWQDLIDNVANFEKFHIPLETQWNDIAEMDLFRDFTNDPVAFDTVTAQNFIGGLHDSGRHYVQILDAGVYAPNPVNDSYPPYDRGHEANVFILNPNGSEYLGVVWPGFTVFPSWLAENTTTWWSDELKRSHDNISFDGIWIDMSEASSFCVGGCGSGKLDLQPVAFINGDVIPASYPEDFEKTNASEASYIASVSASISSVQATLAPPQTTTSWIRPTVTPGARNINYRRSSIKSQLTCIAPYAINNAFYDLAKHDISPNATNRDVNSTQEYDTHNIYAFGVLNATYHALLHTLPNKRPFIIGRGTSPGAGAVAGHWGGDNTSQWRHMYWSIPHALSMALFGIPMFGVDTCGYLGNTDEELYRNYNNNNIVLQEPYLWASVITASQSAMAIRYALLPYMYTLFHGAHTTGSTVMRAMAWEFPCEPSLASADRQFMLGPSLLITPVLEPSVDYVNGVFPGAKDGTIWYDWYNQSRIMDSAALAGENVTISAPLGHIPLYVRGGSVLPMQPLDDGLTVRDCRGHDWSLLVGLDAQGSACGNLYMDDGESVEVDATLEADFKVSGQSLCVHPWGNFNETKNVANVTIMGVKEATKVYLKDTEIDTFTYDQDKELLQVTGLDMGWSCDWTLSWA